jgi:raffinose/stachyose/melibiose transport system permease protein
MNHAAPKPSFFSRQESINLLYIPALIFFAVFTIYPLISGVQLSFTDWNGYTPEKNFVGLSNYTRLFSDPYFIQVLINTLIFGVGSTIFQQIFGLLLALVLDMKIRSRDLARAIVYLPVLISPVIMGTMYYMLLQYNNGALNDIVILLGGRKIAWLSDSNAAIAIIVFVNTIQFMGISMILYLTGLQNISDEYYDATAIDGASKWQQFRYITMPLLYPAAVTSITINLIGGLKLFDIIKVLTNGGPGYATNSVSTYIGITYFNAQSAGYASSMGVILFLLIMGFTLVLNKIFSQREV